RTIPSLATEPSSQVLRSCLWQYARELLAAGNPPTGECATIWHDHLPAAYADAWPVAEIEEILTKARQKVQYPVDGGILDESYAYALTAAVPDIAKQFRSSKIRRLVVLCRELQRRCDPEPFFLSCRSVARLFDVDHSRASKWLNKLIGSEVLECVAKGKFPRRAAEYRYIGKYSDIPF
ncbi:MAG: hypothetical protein N2C12_12495, partial [Planctomycetales bacterium]